MTTEQRKHIQTAMKSKIAVYCATSDEATMLFEAMEWQTKYNVFDDDFHYWSDSTCDDGWDCAYLKAYVPDGYQVIDFSTLIAPHTLIIGLRAAAKAQGVDLEWLEEDVPFMCGFYVYKICNGHIFFKEQINMQEWHSDDAMFVTLMRYLDQIHPILKYSAETVEDARAAMRLGYNYVSRGEYGSDRRQPGLAVNKGRPNHWALSGTFADIQPCQCVALADILGGE